MVTSSRPRKSVLQKYFQVRESIVRLLGIEKRPRCIPLTVLLTSESLCQTPLVMNSFVAAEGPCLNSHLGLWKVSFPPLFYDQLDSLLSVTPQDQGKEKCGFAVFELAVKC